MSKPSKNIAHIGQVAHIDFSFPGSDKLFTSLKDKVLPSQTYLLAVSGGSDSMLTASLVYKFFVQQKLSLQNLVLVHCNHKVRTESDQESIFLQKFFTGTNFHLISRKAKLARINEESLRKWRYAEFTKLAKKYKATTLIVGHNLTDRIESTFLHLLRGAHLKGFIAMSSYEKHHLFPGYMYRPLLAIAKENILQICHRYGIPYSTDKSNFDSSTSLRNKLRNEVLPGLYQLAHKATPTENSFQQSMLHVYEELSKTTDQKTFLLTPLTVCSLWKTKFAYEVSATGQSRTDETTVQMLRALHITHDMSGPQIRELTKFFTNAEQGYKHIQSTYFFLAHGKKYIISAPTDFRQKTVEKSKKIATLGQVKRYNFTLPIIQKEWIGASLRFAKSSDRYHNKTRNQYCITAKIPVFWRNFIPVIIKQNKIIQIFKEII